MPHDQLRAEIDRVGASFAKAGAARHVVAIELGDEAWLLGPPSEHPRVTWRGATFDALAALAKVPDDAGPDAVWAASGWRASLRAGTGSSRRGRRWPRRTRERGV